MPVLGQQSTHLSPGASQVHPLGKALIPGTATTANQELKKLPLKTGAAKHQPRSTSKEQE